MCISSGAAFVIPIVFVFMASYGAAMGSQYPTKKALGIVVGTSLFLGFLAVLSSRGDYAVGNGLTFALAAFGVLLFSTLFGLPWGVAGRLRQEIIDLKRRR